jgi:hypothetical protein
MRHLFLFFVLLLGNICNSQVIDSIRIYPQQPTTDDTIRIFVYSTFNYGGCTGESDYSILNKEINSSSIHCLGILAYICQDIDTFNIDPLPEGIYHFYHTLSSGLAPAPCSPGIVADDHDTLTFTVESQLAINTIKHDFVKISPNPVKQKCLLTFDSNNNPVQRINVRDISHRKVIEQENLDSHQIELDLTLLSSGIYFIELTGKDENVSQLIKIVKE